MSQVLYRCLIFAIFFLFFFVDNLDPLAVNWFDEQGQILGHPRAHSKMTQVKPFQQKEKN